MTNFKVFTNATPKHRGKPIAIDVNVLTSIFESTLDDDTVVTTLYSQENVWSVEEEFDEVINIINIL